MKLRSHRCFNAAAYDHASPMSGVGVFISSITNTVGLIIVFLTLENLSLQLLIFYQHANFLMDFYDILF